MNQIDMIPEFKKGKDTEQAGAELGQAQPRLGLKAS